MPHVLPAVRVAGADEAAALDAETIAAGVPSRALMQRAGAAAAAEIALRIPEALRAGAWVLVGPGNNGGDGWVVARALAAAGVTVRVHEPLPARTPDCIAERVLALPAVRLDEACRPGREGVIVDALLGTGARGVLRAPFAGAAAAIAEARAAGAVVVALDLPTGIDATLGASTAHVTADLTLTFGTVKRGHLLARGACGRVVVLDIGLATPSGEEGGTRLVDARWVAARLPRVAADAHKGTRGRVVVVGGARGMAGAAVLAGRAALRSAAGLVRLLVHGDSLEAVQRAEPAALAVAWPGDAEVLGRDVLQWADAVGVGPGLGRDDEASTLLLQLLARYRGPVVVDADAINAFAGRPEALAALLRGREALLTPHPAELARLLGTTTEDVVARRFEVVREAAERAGAAVLLKGVPTVVARAEGVLLASATGTSALATGGSGDVLTGIAAALLAQGLDARTAGACAAWVHGRAAERASASVASSPRGVALEDVVASLSDAWPTEGGPSRYPVLAELPPA